MPLHDTCLLPHLVEVGPSRVVISLVIPDPLLSVQVGVVVIGTEVGVGAETATAAAVGAATATAAAVVRRAAAAADTVRGRQVESRVGEKKACEGRKPGQTDENFRSYSGWRVSC